MTVDNDISEVVEEYSITSETMLTEDEALAILTENPEGSRVSRVARTLVISGEALIEYLTTSQYVKVESPDVNQLTRILQLTRSARVVRTTSRTWSSLGLHLNLAIEPSGEGSDAPITELCMVAHYVTQEQALKFLALVAPIHDSLIHATEWSDNDHLTKVKNEHGFNEHLQFVLTTPVTH